MVSAPHERHVGGNTRSSARGRKAAIFSATPSCWNHHSTRHSLDNNQFDECRVHQNFSLMLEIDRHALTDNTLYLPDAPLRTLGMSDKLTRLVKAEVLGHAFPPPVP